MKRFKDIKVGDNVFILFTEEAPGAYDVEKIKDIKCEECEGEEFTVFTTEGGRDFEVDEDTINDSVLGDPAYGDMLVFYADVEPIIGQLNFEKNSIIKAIQKLEKYK